MEPSKKDSTTESGGKDRKAKQSPTSHGTPTKKSHGTTAVSTQSKASTSQASYTHLSTHTQSEPLVADASNIYGISDGFWLPPEAGQTSVDLLGLASQTLQSHELGGNAQSFFIDSVDAIIVCECPYHRPILMSDNVDGFEKSLDPMARWLAEGNSEQHVVLYLLDGQLSIHKDCQCSDMLPPGMEMEIGE